MVMENPMQLTTVKAVPRLLGSTFFETSVENIGESATTATPQNIMNKRNAVGPRKKASGQSRQQDPDAARARVAVFFSPHRSERYPAPTQAKLPTPIIKKLKREIFQFGRE